ncbi:hypothetical protein LLE49_22245 [Alicyclobacillus tolerans]|uniref:hypothetical protein n=1 Tax=Alicyclobacillus tolerans TaxID=90970 RepID=UPI001F265825|nr:hypothetical protein [Alicyclobacillus tolerans]MCF8567443.1 hypothetical protein [Alicyclobacillus tolerans]
MPREDFPMTPVYGEPDLYYRHAKGENLFVLGPESNRHKSDWIRRQIQMFSSLGWRFLILDLSPMSEMGAPHMLGGNWSNIERHAVLNMTPPVIIRTPRLRDLLETLDEVNILKLEYPSMNHVTVVHLGNIRALDKEEKGALAGSLLKIQMYDHGVWLVTEHFQSYPMEDLDRFQTHVVLAQDEPDIELPKWTKKFNLGNVDVTELDDEEAYFLFRGKSEGARHLYVCNISNARDWE